MLGPAYGNIPGRQITQQVTSSGEISQSTTLVISSGTNTLVMPTISVVILKIKSLSGTATLDPGANTIENGNSVTATVNRSLYLDGSTWIEL
jgi:hypothetical protein